MSQAAHLSWMVTGSQMSASFPSGAGTLQGWHNSPLTPSLGVSERRWGGEVIGKHPPFVKLSGSLSASALPHSTEEGSLGSLAREQ